MDLLTLRSLTQDLASVTGAELAPGSRCGGNVPHVSVITRSPLIMAAAFGPDTLLTALARASDGALPLGAGQRGAGAAVAPGLSSVTHTGGAGIFLPLFSMLVLLSR